MITCILEDGTQVDVSSFVLEEFPCPECAHWLCIDLAKVTVENVRANYAHSQGMPPRYVWSMEPNRNIRDMTVWHHDVDDMGKPEWHGRSRRDLIREIYKLRRQLAEVPKPETRAEWWKRVTR